MSAVTNENYEDFKKKYAEAVAENRQVFVFDGAEVLTSFAKYLIEYVDEARKSK